MYSLIGKPAVALALFYACAASGHALAQEAAPTPAADAVAEPARIPAAAMVIPVGTVVHIVVDEPIGSKSSVRGARFKIRLAQPIIVNTQVLAPAGAEGVGEVVHAARARGGGKAGELILAARYLDIEGGRVTLRGFRVGVAGKDNSGDALALGLVTSFAGAGLLPLGMLVSGGEIEVPAGTPAIAVVSANITLNP